MAGILPHNLFTNSSYQIFSILEILLLSLALGDKINIFKKEFSSNLEIKVTERTRELSAMIEIVNEQKKEVELTLEELKNTQAQLLESEKKASLGQLVSVVAHEINNPIGAIQASSEIAEISFNSITLEIVFRIFSLVIHPYNSAVMPIDVVVIIKIVKKSLAIEKGTTSKTSIKEVILGKI
jgi:signal transduction histidine kinase